ncbi:unnamed protein product [Peronospora belbahrii]|uniref:Chromo domain-containing protein n=1 Tax=Peronospora belbahrii TaxID=622444 RepID=A0AAU9KJH3_9STRA|nr:unnamed protein product [Peronospora belbahrii]
MWYICPSARGREFPDRPSAALETDEIDRVDFDECLLPEDSWARELEEGEYEVEEILGARTGKKTRYGRQQRELLVRWKGCEDPSRVDVVALNCGALLRDFERKKTRRNRFKAMETYENQRPKLRILGSRSESIVGRSWSFL